MAANTNPINSNIDDPSGNSNGTGNGNDATSSSSNSRAPQRPRAGTMPSIFHLGLASSSSNGKALDPFAVSDELLSPAPHHLNGSSTASVLHAPHGGAAASSSSASSSSSLSARPTSLLGRRLSGNPLSSNPNSGAASSLSSYPSSSSNNSHSSLFTSSNTTTAATISPSSPIRLAMPPAPTPTSSSTSNSNAFLPSQPSLASNSTIPPTPLSLGSSPGTSAATVVNGALSPSIPTSSSATISASSANGGGGASTSPLELRASLLRSSQPVSPDPVAAARLRSGSLTLPPSGLGNGFKPGFYGPPGSGSGTWTPRSTGMPVTPLGMPSSSLLISSEAFIPKNNVQGQEEEEEADASTPTVGDDDDHNHPPPTSIGGILDFLDSDEAVLPVPQPPPSATSTAAAAPHRSSISISNGGSSNSRQASPTSARIPTSTSGLLSAGSPSTFINNNNGSISVPSSAHPSIQNLRQSYQEHSSFPMMQSASSNSALESNSNNSNNRHLGSLSPRSAARLRANTVAAPDPPIIRKSSLYNHLTPHSAGFFSNNGFGDQVNSSNNPHPNSSAISNNNNNNNDFGNNYMDSLSNDLPTFSLNANNATNPPHSAHQMPTYNDYSPYGSADVDNSGHVNNVGYLLNPNRPRASTIGILDETNAHAPHRRRAGTTGQALMPSGLRTPAYDGGRDDYLGTQPMHEADEEHYDSSGSLHTGWAASETQDYSQLQQTYTAPVQFGDRPTTPPAPNLPTRSLWIGNVDARIGSQDLVDAFAVYGHIESVRMLAEKECAFVNFSSAQEAIRAKDDILIRLGGQIQTRGNGLVNIRIGFGRADSAPPTPANRAGGAVSSPMIAISSHSSNMEPSVQTAPTRALWLGSLPSIITAADLLKVFSPYGAIESARVLGHKQCGFINFENLDDAVAARKSLNGLEVLGCEVGPVKIGFAKVPSKMPDTPVFDNTVDPTTAYQALKRLGGATAVPLEEQVSAGHLENFRSPMALQLAANDLNGIGPHSAIGLTQSLQPAVGLSPSLVASEFGLEGRSPQGVPLPSISEQQVLMKELSGDSPDAEEHAQAIAEPRAPAIYHRSIPPPVEDHAHVRTRNLDAPRLRDIRKRLEVPPSQITQAEIDSLATELLDDCVALSSDYIGNVIIQKLFERTSSTLRFVMLERIAPHLASIACHKNGTWAAQKDIVSSPQEISLVCRNLQPYVPSLLLDQFGNYAAQLCLRFFSPMCDFLFDAMIDRCWEIASGRFGARSVRTCMEHPNATRLQHKRVAISVLLNSVNLATNPNGALLLTWLLDTSNLPGRYRLLATRLAPHLSILCPHKVASTTILKIVNQRVDPASSQLIVDAIFSDVDPSILEDILSEQVHGSSFMHKLLGSAYLDQAIRAKAVERVRDILQKGNPHHSPAYGKLCNEVGLPAPLSASGLPHTPPLHKLGRGNLTSIPFPMSATGYQPPLSASNIPHNANVTSPPFNFPSFGSPISPPLRTAPGAIVQGQGSYMPRQASPFQPMFSGNHGSPVGQPMLQDGQTYQGGHMNPYHNMPPPPYQRQQFMHGQYSPGDFSQRHAPMMPSLTAGAQQGYADQYLQNVAALQMSGFTGYPGQQEDGAHNRSSTANGLHANQYDNLQTMQNGQPRLSPSRF